MKLETEEEEEDAEDDEHRLSIDWIRIDPENEWLAIKSFAQADYMWVSQLEKDKDVVAQFEVFLLTATISKECRQSKLCQSYHQ